VFKEMKHLVRRRINVSRFVEYTCVVKEAPVAGLIWFVRLCAPLGLRLILFCECVVSNMSTFISLVNYTLLNWNLTSATQHTTRLSLTWYFSLDPYFVDPDHEIFQYFLRTAPCGLKHVGV
jgi:hypothetical protein